MFGQNAKLPPENGCGGSLKVTKIFYTIQGEGPNVGSPAVFIRLSGCNLACSFCDTEFNEYEILNIDEIVQEVCKLSKALQGLVVITGGEPLRQNIDKLCKLLMSCGYRIQLETNGTIYRSIPHEVEIVCSPKFSESGIYGIDPRFFNHKFAFKFLISAEDKKTPDINFYKEYAKQNGQAQVYLQPMDEYDLKKNKMNLQNATELAMQGGFKLSIQMHKILEIE